jgi:hypothetical protein
MPSKQPKRARHLRSVAPAPEPDLDDDEVIASLVADASERDLAALLHEFPRDRQFVLTIYERFLTRESPWSHALRAQLADALTRCHLHDEADVVRDG